jgi:hypothetical protein
LVVAVAVVVVLFWFKSDSLPVNIGLVAAAALLVLSASVVAPLRLRDRSVPFVVVAAGTAGLLGTVLAIPKMSAPQGPESDASKSVSTSPSTSPSPVPAPKRQMINATNDLDSDPTESERSQQGPLIVSAHHIVANTCSGAPGWRVPLTPKQLGTAPFDTYGDVVAKWAEETPRC